MSAFVAVRTAVSGMCPSALFRERHYNPKIPYGIGLCGRGLQCEAPAASTVGDNMALKTIRALALSSALALPGMAHAAAASPSADYQAIVKDFFDAQWKLHPTAATATGLHNWDNQLDDVSAAAHTREVTLLKGFR